MTKKGFLYISILLLTVVIGFSQKPNKNLIPWTEDYQLNWADFKGRPDKNSNYEALTYSSIGFYTEYKDNKLIIHANCDFDKSKSWVKKGNEKNAQLLKHEQGHFDLTEIYTRKLRQAFSEVKDDIAQKKVQSVFEKNQKEYNIIQKKYDTETKNGTIADQQEIWNEYIIKQLEELKMFKE